MSRCRDLIETDQALMKPMKIFKPATSAEAKRDDLKLVYNSTDSGRIDDASLLKLESEILLDRDRSKGHF